MQYLSKKFFKWLTSWISLYQLLVWTNSLPVSSAVLIVVVYIPGFFSLKDAHLMLPL